MNVYNKAHNKLLNSGFSIYDFEDEVLCELGCVFYTNNRFNIILKHHCFPKIDSIVNESKKIQEILYLKDYNIWNTYFLICVDDIDYDVKYSIEKEKKGLKKYVLEDYRDFDRIPFFENYKKTPPILNNLETDNELLNSIIKLIEEKQGYEINLNQDSVNEIANKIITDKGV